MLIKDNRQEAEISESNWPLLVDLFAKWGHDIEGKIPKKGVEVSNIDDVVNELSAWGIPWKKVNEAEY